ncbi:putative proteasome maturation factor UMP1 [Podospora fimiseda]|uniref:Proteasome maturation factor UMP1 n=1 Tax=Podospora fimiseda TaxID=252190 RepID=A0AAN7H8I5_9PEZI|nr:putative proteasome maturation factor UMP1 [Podospora fimiseda]
MSLRIIPADNHQTTFTHQPSKHNIAPSAPGLHDTLRAGVGPSPLESNQSVSAHPLESRLKQWEATQEALRMEMLRRTYGIAEPVRRGMELKITRDGQWRPVCLGGNKASLHDEILTGRDGIIEWEDVFSKTPDATKVGVQEEIDRKVLV